MHAPGLTRDQSLSLPRSTAAPPCMQGLVSAAVHPPRETCYMKTGRFAPALWASCIQRALRSRTVGVTHAEGASLPPSSQHSCILVVVSILVVRTVSIMHGAHAWCPALQQVLNSRDSAHCRCNSHTDPHFLKPCMDHHTLVCCPGRACTGAVDTPAMQLCLPACNATLLYLDLLCSLISFVVTDAKFTQNTCPSPGILGPTPVHRVSVPLYSVAALCTQSRSVLIQRGFCVVMGAKQQQSTNTACNTWLSRSPYSCEAGSAPKHDAYADGHDAPR